MANEMKVSPWYRTISAIKKKTAPKQGTIAFYEEKKKRTEARSIAAIKKKQIIEDCDKRIAAIRKRRQESRNAKFLKQDADAAMRRDAYSEAMDAVRKENDAMRTLIGINQKTPIEDAKFQALANAIKASSFTTRGPNGIHYHRDKIPSPFNTIPKRKLEAIIDCMVIAGAIKRSKKGALS